MDKKGCYLNIFTEVFEEKLLFKSEKNEISFKEFEKKMKESMIAWI